MVNLNRNVFHGVSYSITRACHAQPFYALQVATPETGKHFRGGCLQGGWPVAVLLFGVWEGVAMVSLEYR